MIVGEAFRLPHYADLSRNDLGTPRMSVPTGLIKIDARIIVALCGKIYLPLFLLTLKAQKKKLSKRKRRSRRATRPPPRELFVKSSAKTFKLGAALIYNKIKHIRRDVGSDGYVP